MKRGYSNSDVIQRLRQLQGDQTQAQFAGQIGITQQYLSDVLQGNRRPGKKITDYLGLEPGYIKPESAA
jgi:transcriptional regulator with XRE-family HTH domain